MFYVAIQKWTDNNLQQCEKLVECLKFPTENDTAEEWLVVFAGTRINKMDVE